MRTFFMRWFTLAALLLSPIGQAIPAYAAGPFSDVTPTTPYAKAIAELKADRVIGGYEDGSFKPSAQINRAELLKIILEARGETVDSRRCFPDVQDQWFARYVCTAKTAGIVSGYDDGLFRPEKPVNFVEEFRNLLYFIKNDPILVAFRNVLGESLWIRRQRKGKFCLKQIKINGAFEGRLHPT